MQDIRRTKDYPILSNGIMTKLVITRVEGFEGFG